MFEISCTEKIMEALCHCAERILYVGSCEKLTLSQTIETLSRSIEILKGTAEGGAE